MLLVLLSYKYMWVLICTENAYHANTRRYKQEGESSPTDSRGGPHRFKRWPPPRVWYDTLLCVPLCSVWGMDSRGAPHHVCDVALCSVWHLVPLRIRRTLARRGIHPRHSDTRHALSDAGMTMLLTRVTVQGT